MGAANLAGLWGQDVSALEMSPRPSGHGDSQTQPRPLRDGATALRRPGIPLGGSARSLPPCPGPKRRPHFICFEPRDSEPTLRQHCDFRLRLLELRWLELGGDKWNKPIQQEGTAVCTTGLQQGRTCPRNRHLQTHISHYISGTELGTASNKQNPSAGFWGGTGIQQASLHA